MDDRNQMNAIVQDTYGTPDVLRLERIERPQPGNGEVLVRVHAAGVDPGVWHLMSGLPYLVRLMGYGLRKPRARIPGSDFSGVVETVGTNVTGIHPGDEVFGICKGAFAEYALASADRVALKPESLSHEEAAVVPTSALAALQGLRDAGNIKPGQKVLIVGATGGVGTFAVQLARALGAGEVTGVGSTRKLDMLRSIGAHRVIDYTKGDFTEGHERYDLILDIAGNRPLSRLRRVLTQTGTLVIIGGENGGRWIGGTDRQLRALLTSRFTSQTLRPLFSAPHKDDLESLRSLLEVGDVRPVMDRAYRLNETADALRSLTNGHSRGKSVISLVSAPPDDARQVRGEHRGVTAGANRARVTPSDYRRRARAQYVQPSSTTSAQGGSQQ
jgi:NADPH:quinone reductase-like Zn-dependent oxidoreductase